MNPIEDMQIFVATADAGSITAASERLGMSKQFVSRRIMALEERLGVRLMNRTTRRLSVTELGREYYERAVRIIEDVADAEHSVSGRGATPRGTLRISAPVSFATMHLSALIPVFLARHPDVSIEMDLNDRRCDLVAEGYDMALRIGVLSDSTLVARRIAPVRVVVCGSPGYLRRRGTPRQPDELRNHDCLPYGHGRAVDWEFERDGERVTIPVGGRLRVNNGELARDAAIADLGLAMLPTFIVGEALRDGRLVTLLDEFLPPPIALHVVYPKHRQSFAAIRAMCDFLQQQLARGEGERRSR
jgi:DNA-binding transcriptional LysR family regulator